MDIEAIRKDPDNQDWHTLSSRGTPLSEDFIREFQDRVNWSWISYQQILSEDFIREFQDKVDWNEISYKQKMSKNFIVEFVDKIIFRELVINENISNDIKQFCRIFI